MYPTLPEPSCEPVQLSGEHPVAKPIAGHLGREVGDNGHPTAAARPDSRWDRTCRIMPSAEWLALDVSEVLDTVIVCTPDNPRLGASRMRVVAMLRM